jgi:hypothetical protein
VFHHLAECHLNIMRRNSEEFSLIQIGRFPLALTILETISFFK